jgi:hypothetical protein
MRTLVACCVVAVFAMVGRPVTGIAAPPKVACSLLTTAQVTAALAVAVGPGRQMTKEVCQWSELAKSGDDSVKVQVTLSTLDRYNKFKAARNVTVTAVAHLGDDAYYSAQTADNTQVALCLRKGETAVIVHAFGGKKTAAEYQSMEKAMAEAVLPAL